MHEDEPAETLFAGPARAVPAESSVGFAFLVASDAPAGPAAPMEPEEVRHAAGYAPFVRRLVALGAEPGALAADLPALLEVIAAHPDLVDDDPEAAGTFFGNALAVAHPAASWRRPQQREVGTDSRSVVVDDALRRLARDADARRQFLAMLPEWADADEQHARDARWRGVAMDATGAPVLDVPEQRFTRPRIAAPVLRDESGAVIPYGERWPGQPPEEAYSRLTHPERFAPVQQAAEALIEYLTGVYDVAAEESRTPDGERVVALTPARGAPVRLRFTDLPGVVLQAGAFFEEAAPSCGCDACDETAESAVERLEGPLLAIAAGGLTERYPIGPGAHHAWGLRMIDGGSRGGSGGVTDERRPSGDLAAALAALPDGRWPAWPRAVRGV